MRLTVDRREISSKLALAGRILPSRMMIPSFEHIGLSARDGSVELRATDIEIGLRLPLLGTIEEPGGAALPKITVNVVRSMPDGHITIESATDGNQVTISGGGSSFSMNSIPESDLLEIPPAVALCDAVLRASDFCAAVARVTKAASNDQTRPVLTGVLMRIDEDGLTMVATDSYRLAVARAPLSDTPAGPWDGIAPREALVPSRAFAEFSRVVSALDAGRVEIALSEHAVFRASGASLISRLIEGQFPDFRKILPENFEHEFAFNRAELLGAIKRIGTIAKDRPIRLRFADGGMTVSATNELFGSGEERIPANYSGEPLEICFNPRFLREGIEMVDHPEVHLAIINPLRPMMIFGENKDDGFYLLMPMKLQ
jgi:DNA polymerase-3 subunit beta